MNENIKDPELEQLFDAFRPTPEDGADFLARLDKQLDAIELVRQLQAQQRQRNRYILAGTFVGGLVAGLLLYAFVMPAVGTLPAVSVGMQSQVLRFIFDNAQLFAIMLLCLMVVAGVIVVISTWLDMAERRENRDMAKRMKREYSH
ncbi:MAG: hypothetical protein UHL07_00325 [Bacteroidaceae bacterium]|nr:hypothetical protein [Bacteroidaceae bacterium]